MRISASDAMAARTPLSRVRTGNREADEVLDGGFPAGSINIIMGQPGTGKTIFVEQLIFDNAGGDRPILYLTTLSEPLPKVIKFLQRLAFFDEAKLGRTVLYEDIGPRLAERGVSALMPALREAIKAHAPKIIVIDSFKAIHDLAESPREMRLMLYELTGLLSAYATTTFLVGEYAEEESRVYPEFAVVDGIVQFLRRDLSARDERYLRVRKLRGSRYLEGTHAFRVDQSGLQTFPRLVTPETPKSYEALFERVTSGVPGLDPLLGGGLWRGSTTLVVGPTGGGKTTIGLQFAVAGLPKREPALYVNFQENPMQLCRALKLLGVDPEAAREQGLVLQYESPVELQIDSVIVKLFRLIEEKNIQRVVIDSITDLEGAATDAKRLHDYLYSLVQHFAVKRTTCLMTFESASLVPTDGGVMTGKFSYMSDNIVHLAMGITTRIARTISVLKSRASANDLTVHTLELGEGGARVL